MVKLNFSLEEVSKMFAKEVAQEHDENSWKKYADSFQTVKEQELFLLKTLTQSFEHITFDWRENEKEKYTNYSVGLHDSDRFESSYISFDADKNWSAHKVRMMLLLLLSRRMNEGFCPFEKDSFYCSSDNDGPFKKTYPEWGKGKGKLSK